MIQLLQNLLFILLLVILLASLSMVFLPHLGSWLIRASLSSNSIRHESFDDALKKTTTIKDITYPSNWGRNTYDLIRPKTIEDNLPVIIWMHGGFYVGGDKSHVSDYAVEIASRGYAVINMNYQLAPKAKFPSQLHQIGEVLQHVREHALEYHLDSNQLFFAGDSAGAQIIAQFVNIQTNNNYSKKISIDPILKPHEIMGVLLFCGPVDSELSSDYSLFTRFFVHQALWAYGGIKNWQEDESIHLFSIVDNVDVNFPSTFITDGNKNTFTQANKKLAKVLDDVGVHQVSIFYDDSPHLPHEYQFNLRRPQSVETFKLLISFLDEKTKRTGA